MPAGGTCKCDFEHSTHTAVPTTARNSTRNYMPPTHQHLVLPLPFFDIARVADQDCRARGALESATDERVGQG